MVDGKSKRPKQTETPEQLEHLEVSAAIEKFFPSNSGAKSVARGHRFGKGLNKRPYYKIVTTIAPDGKVVNQREVLDDPIISHVSPTRNKSADLAEEKEKLSSNKSLAASTELLRAAMEVAGVPESERASIISDTKIAMARAMRPKWKDRQKDPHFNGMTAPEFLREVHADDIHDNVVSTEIIGAIDRPLMKAVQLYMVDRRKRAGSLDLGHAAGLKFILSRPPTRGSGAERAPPSP